MEITDLNEATDVLNEHLKDIGDPDEVENRYSAGRTYLSRSGRCSIGSGGAKVLLEEMGAIVVKTLYLPEPDETRIWLNQITREEVEVTKTVERFTFESEDGLGFR